MEQSLKFPPRGLQQLIAIAAALTAWLVISWRGWLPLKLFEVFNHLRQFLKYCIHHVPTIQKSVAMWALSLLHIFALCCFPSPHLESQKSGGRPTCTADSLFHSTWCCMAPNQGRWNRKSDFSNTFELGRDAYRETVEQYLSRSSDSTKFSSSCNQVRRQLFCHCTEAPSSGSSVPSVYRLGLLW